MSNAVQGHRTRRAHGTVQPRDLRSGRLISRAGDSKIARNFYFILRDEHPDWSLDTCADYAVAMADDPDFVSALREAGRPLLVWHRAALDELAELLAYGSRGALGDALDRGDDRRALLLLERRRAPSDAPVDIPAA
jgi:hypothetical protein